MITTKRAMEVFDYDPQTGVVVSKLNRGGYKVGDAIRPSMKNGGVWGFTVDRGVVSALRLVRLMQGHEMVVWEDFIFRDGDRTNLRASNVVRRPVHKTLTPAVANEYFRLDGSTLRWKRWVAATATPGDRAGTKTKDGGMRVVLCGKFYNSIHVAYLLVYGDVPDGYAVRPIDGDWSNCNPHNLKVVRKGARTVEEYL